MDSTPNVVMPYPMRKSRIISILGWALAAIGVLGHVLWATGGALVREGNWIALDFHVYYQAAKVLGRGEDIYLAGISPPYIYPPLLAILVLPLSWLQVTPATILWKLFQHVCLLAAGWLLVRLLPGAIRPLVAGVLLFGLLTVVVKSEIKEGQVNSLILLVTVGAIYAILMAASSKQKAGGRVENTEYEAHNTLHASRFTFHAIAGTLLALAVSIKVLPVLLVAYLWWRGPRTAAAIASGGFLALQLISLLVTPATLRYWTEVFPSLFSEAFHSPDNQSLGSSISRALLPGDGYYPNTQLVDGVAVRPIVTWAANLLVLTGAAWVLWASGKRDDPTEAGRTMRGLLQFGLAFLTIHLVSGSTWPHHLVTLSAPIAALFGAWWLDREAGIGGWHTALWIPLIIGAGIALLMRTPEEWLLLAGEVAPQSPLLALIAVSTGTMIVISLWAVVAATLLHRPGSRRQEVSHTHS